MMRESVAPHQSDFQSLARRLRGVLDVQLRVGACRQTLGRLDGVRLDQLVMEALAAVTQGQNEGQDVLAVLAHTLDAREWDGLRALAGRMCVTAAPYAQASLGALQRIGDARLTEFTMSGSADVVQQILGVPPVLGATLTGDEPLTDNIVDLLGAQGSTVAVAAAEPGGDDAGTPALAPRRLSATVVAAPFDPAVGAALAAAGDDPVTPSYLDSGLVVPLHHDSLAARRQNAVSAMVWRALTPDAETRLQLLMPPLVWGLQPADAQSILAAFASAIHTGLAIPRPLPAVIAETAGDPQPPAPLDRAAGTDAPGRFDDEVVARVAGQIPRVWGLTVDVAAARVQPRLLLRGHADLRNPTTGAIAGDGLFHFIADPQLQVARADGSLVHFPSGQRARAAPSLRNSVIPPCGPSSNAL